MAKYDFTPISNIITEMIIKGATLKELGRMTEYSRKLIDCEKAYIENDIQALIEKYCGDEPVELTEREKAYIESDIKACEEKRIDLNAEFARVLDRGPIEVTSIDGPEYHANDYVHFEASDGFHFGRIMSYSPATMQYTVYDLGEGTFYHILACDIISKEVKKDGEQTEE